MGSTVGSAGLTSLLPDASLLSLWILFWLLFIYHFIWFCSDAKMPAAHNSHAARLGAANQPVNTPSAPRNLATHLVSSRFVTLTWQAPTTTSFPLSTYSVYYKQVGSTRERVFNTTVNQREANIQGLRADTNYAFRVVAYNQHGPGESSEEIQVRTHPEGTLLPKLQLQLQWKIFKNWKSLRFGFSSVASANGNLFCCIEYMAKNFIEMTDVKFTLIWRCFTISSMIYANLGVRFLLIFSPFFWSF